MATIIYSTLLSLAAQVASASGTALYFDDAITFQHVSNVLAKTDIQYAVGRSTYAEMILFGAPSDFGELLAREAPSTGYSFRLVSKGKTLRDFNPTVAGRDQAIPWPNFSRASHAGPFDPKVVFAGFKSVLGTDSVDSLSYLPRLMLGKKQRYDVAFQVYMTSASGAYTGSIINGAIVGVYRLHGN